MSDQLKRRPLLYDWCSLSYTKLEIILFSFHCRVIRQRRQLFVYLALRKCKNDCKIPKITLAQIFLKLLDFLSDFVLIA